MLGQPGTTGMQEEHRQAFGATVRQVAAGAHPTAVDGALIPRTESCAAG
jgi:hypothetical protein